MSRRPCYHIFIDYLLEDTVTVGFHAIFFRGRSLIMYTSHGSPGAMPGARPVRLLHFYLEST